MTFSSLVFSLDFAVGVAFVLTTAFAGAESFFFPGLSSSSFSSELLSELAELKKIFKIYINEKFKQPIKSKTIVNDLVQAFQRFSSKLLFKEMCLKFEWETNWQSFQKFLLESKIYFDEPGRCARCRI